MNSMTIFGLSSFSAPHGIVQINYLKYRENLLISIRGAGFTKLLTNTADSIKNKNMTERSFRKQGFQYYCNRPCALFRTRYGIEYECENADAKD